MKARIAGLLKSLWQLFRLIWEKLTPKQKKEAKDRVCNFIKEKVEDFYDFHKKRQKEAK